MMMPFPSLMIWFKIKISTLIALTYRVTLRSCYCCSGNAKKNDNLYNCIEMLLQRPDIDINLTTENHGFTAFMFLCRGNNEKIVDTAQLLVAKGCDVNKKDGFGFNAKYYLENNRELSFSKKSAILELILS